MAYTPIQQNFGHAQLLLPHCVSSDPGYRANRVDYAMYGAEFRVVANQGMGNTCILYLLDARLASNETVIAGQHRGN